VPINKPAALAALFEGWGNYQANLVQAVAPLSREQLAWRPGPSLRAVGEVVRHMALGRLDWFLRMGAPGSRELAGQITAWDQDPHGNRYVKEEAVAAIDDASELVRWLDDSWRMIERTLAEWTADDLWRTYRHTWRGSTYAIPYQWTVWRIMAHDLHHGGELALMLGMQGVQNFELGDLGGHTTLPPLAKD
jgi:uncharacterized damage-inducible protein DinB